MCLAWPPQLQHACGRVAVLYALVYACSKNSKCLLASTDWYSNSAMQHSQQPHHLAKDSDDAWAAVPERLHRNPASDDGSPRPASTDGEDHDMGDGWVESITGLREGDGATDLLINGSSAAPISKVLLRDWACGVLGPETGTRPCSGTSYAERQYQSCWCHCYWNRLQEGEAAVAATLASAGMHDDASSEFETRLEHAVQALIAEVQDHSVADQHAHPG